MSALRLGPGIDPETDVGPLIDAPARDRLGRLVADTAADGAVVHAGAGAVPEPGYFLAPTVVEQVDHDGVLFYEELFGPVAPVAAFTSEEQAVAMANDTEYGLVAYADTRDLDVKHVCVDR
jgi:succinate-semialdehyde dehydrogenase/glutarate-semialdehyde dehydrogenase